MESCTPTPTAVNRSVCTVGCICCIQLINHNVPCVCWRPVATVSTSTQTDQGTSYGYNSDSYFNRGNIAYSMLHRGIREVTTATNSIDVGLSLLHDMFPEIRSSPKTDKKLSKRLRRNISNRQYYRALKTDASSQGITVRKMLSGRKRKSSTSDHLTDLIALSPRSGHSEEDHIDIQVLSPTPSYQDQPDDVITEVHPRLGQNEEDLIDNDMQSLSTTPSNQDQQDVTIPVIAEVHVHHPPRQNQEMPSPKPSNNQDTTASEPNHIQDTPESEHNSQNQDTPALEHNQNQATPVVEHNQNQDAPALEHNQNQATPVVEHNQGTPVLEHNQDTPVVEHNQGTPALEHNQNQDAPALEHNQNQDAQALEHNQNQATSVVEHNQDTPVLEHNQDTPVLEHNQDTSVLEHNQDTPALEPSQNLDDSLSDDDANSSYMYYLQLYP